MNALAKDETAQQRILRRRLVDEASGCWNFIGCTNSVGYGRITYDSKLTTAHRLSYQAFVGPIPNGLFVLHKCDNRACVNPDHLFLGTQRDNIMDMIAKGRKVAGGVRGARHHAAKLTEPDVMDMRKSGKHYAELAAEYGVSGSTVCDVISRRTWRHV